MSVDHTKNIIEVQNVSFSYGDIPVLENITLTVHQGDYLGIVGPNGSGKSTLLKVMVGLLQPDAGSVRVFGKTARAAQRSSRIGYVPQKAIHFDPLFPATVREIVSMGRFGKKGVFRRMVDADQQVIDRCLEHVGMIPYQHRLIGDLSSGQQQRVFIARALAAEPDVIFLDEPTVGVDVHAQEQFYNLLKTLNQELGLTLVLISHDIDVIANEATELACINRTLVYHGEPKEFIRGDYLQKLYGKNIRFILHDH